MKKTILFLLCTLCFLVAVASIACTGGGTHEHYFTQEVATVKYLASDATCTQSATYYYSCKCGIKDTNTFEYGTPLGHDFSDWKVVTQPTETEEGLKTRECMRKGCGYTESENIKIIGHTHSFTEQIITDEFLATKATCVNKATYYYSCACGEKSENTFEYGEPLGHDFSDWKVVTQPTETEEGLKTRECKRTGCDFSENKSIHVLSHTHNFTAQIATDEFLATKATCTKKATYYYSCVCGENGTRTFEYGDPIGHNFNAQIVTVEFLASSATCVKKAAYYYACSLCEEKGTKTYEYGNSLGHIYGNWVVDKEATCSVTGSKHKSCTRYGCTDTVTEDIGKIDHSASDWIVDTEETCTTDGSKHKECTVCHTVLETETIPAGHNYVSGICTRCGTPEAPTEGLKYSLNTDRQSCSCTGLGSAKDTDIVVASEYKGLPVTRIGDEAFSGCSNLTSITIPEGVTSIGREAFSGCSNLTSVTIPDSVISIGREAFSFCRNLTSLTIPEGVTSIGEYAFFGCRGLTSITIPDSVTSIGDKAFSGCSSLTTITIPNNVKKIGDETFSGCSSLTTITIPDGVTSIGYWAFSGCSSLTSVTIPDSVTSIGDRAFSLCSSLTSITIPDRVTSIGYEVFIFCSSLTSVTIPDSVTSIGDSAFYGCNSLTTITIPDSVKAIGDKAFSGCSSLTSITIPDRVTSIGYEVFYGCNSLTSITIPDGVTAIVGRAFYGCSGLEKIVVSSGNTKYHDFGNCLIETESKTLILGCKKSLIPTDGSVTSIDYMAFGGCSSLTSITIPDSVTSIGANAFYGCSGLEKIVVSSGNTKYHDAGNCLIETESKTLILGCKKSLIPTDGSVTSIGYMAFGGCSSLTSITIPDSVTTIATQAFTDCSGLISVAIPNSVTSFGGQVFFHCNNLQYNIYDNARYLGNKNNPYFVLVEAIDDKIVSCNINQKTKIIAMWAFGYCNNLTTITIPDSVKAIGDAAFRFCSNLTTITIPDSVKAIGDAAFYFCKNLQYNIYDNAEYLGNTNNPYLVLISAKDNTISSCNINQKTKLIADSAFYGCTRLASITIPNSVTSIGNWAFRTCDILTNVTFKNTNGWKVINNKETQTLQSSSLSNVYTAAENLTSYYCDYTWERG